MAVAGTYYTDCAKSRDEMNRLLDGMASGGRITAAQATDAKSDVEVAYDECDGEAAQFWNKLAERIEARRDVYAAWSTTKGQSCRTPARAYLATVLSGLQAVKSDQETAYMNSWSKWWDDVVVQSGADYAKVAQQAGTAARDTVEAVKNPWVLWGAAALVLGLVVLKGR